MPERSSKPSDADELEAVVLSELRRYVQEAQPLSGIVTIESVNLSGEYPWTEVVFNVRGDVMPRCESQLVAWIWDEKGEFMHPAGPQAYASDAMTFLVETVLTGGTSEILNSCEDSGSEAAPRYRFWPPLYDAGILLAETEEDAARRRQAADS